MLGIHTPNIRWGANQKYLYIYPPMRSISIFLLIIITLSAQPIIAQVNNSSAGKLKFEALTINEGLSQGMIICMTQDRYGFMWFGTKDGLNRYDGYHFKVFRNNQGDSCSLSANYISSIYEDKQGRLWIGTVNGLNLFDREKENFTRFTNNNKRNTSLSSSQILAIIEDQQGNLIVAEPYHIDKLTVKQDKGINSFTITHARENLPFPSYNLYSTSYHNYYITTILKETYQLFLNDFPSIQTKAITAASQLSTDNWKVDKFIPWDINQSNAAEHITLFYKDKSGTLWIGSNGYGLLKHNTYSQKFHHTGNSTVVHIGQSEKGTIMINDQYIEQEIFDKEKRIVYDPVATKNPKRYSKEFSESSYMSYSSQQYIWFANDNSLYRYTKSNKLMQQWKLPVKQTQTPFTLVNSIYDNEKGNVWVGTSSGLLKFNLKDTTWNTYLNKQGDTTSISTNNVLSICPAKDARYLWIGTDGGGLNLMDTRTEKFYCYTTAHGLPNDVVYGVLADDQYNLWLSTNKGLSRFNPENKTFKNFEEKDGLQSNEFNRGAYFKTRDGWLFFGGVNGFNYFNPKELKDNHFIPQVLITDIKIRNKPVSFRDQDAPLSKPAYLSSQISLPYSDNMISFEFAAMDLTDPGKNVFKYKMEGFDPNWISAGNSHSATYTNLDPGTYTFMVKGSNVDGVFNETPTTFIVTILPPWYMTWWLRTLLVAVTAFIIYSIYKYRLKNALRLQQVRNDIAQDLHDEIGSNLSTIAIFTDMAISKSINKKEGVTPLLNKINNYTQTSMEAMSDIVWMINSRNDKFENIIVHMREHAAELLEAKSIALYIQVDEKLNAIKLDMARRKNFYLIYKEALNNNVKYAECKNVWISIEQKGSSIQLKIKDDGKGFDTSNPDRGNGLINMQKRTELLKGSLTIESAPNEGTTTTLQFSI